LQNAAFDLVANAIGIDGLATIHRSGRADQADATGLVVKNDLGGERRIGAEVFVSRECKVTPRSRFPLKTGPPEPLGTALMTSRARGSARWRSRNSTGSAPLACASSSIKLSIEKMFIYTPKLRSAETRSGMAGTKS
jgi:hypothetical protein